MRPIAEILQDSEWTTAYAPPETAVSRRTPQIARLDDLHVTHPALAGAVAAARRWQSRKAEYPGASLVLTGPYGTGKTHIARTILWSVCYTDAGGVPVCPVGRFYTATDLMMRLQPVRTDWGGIDIPAASVIVGEIPVLVIDDVGAEQRLPFVAADDQTAELQARYFRVLDYCYTRQISVVLTSNLAPPELATHLGGRCWDRLAEMAPRGFVVSLAGVASWRQAKSGR